MGVGITTISMRKDSVDKIITYQRPTRVWKKQGW